MEKIYKIDIEKINEKAEAIHAKWGCKGEHRERERHPGDAEHHQSAAVGPVDRAAGGREGEQGEEAEGRPEEGDEARVLVVEGHVHEQEGRPPDSGGGDQKQPGEGEERT